MRLARSLVSIVVLLSFLAACTSPTAQPTGIELRTVTGAQVQPVGAAFLVVAPSEFPVDVTGISQPEDLLARAAASEPVSGFYMFGATIFDESGKAFVAIPDVDDIPANSLDVPSEAFAAILPGGDCSIVASDPAARVSIVITGYGLYPGFIALTAGYGLTSVASTEPITDTMWLGPDFTGDLISFHYADRDVEISTTGTDCAGLALDLQMEEGWNVVATQLVGMGALLAVTSLDGPLYLAMPPLGF